MLNVFYFKVTTLNNKRDTGTLPFLVMIIVIPTYHWHKQRRTNEGGSNDNGEHEEAKVEVTLLSLSEDEDFASEVTSRERLFLVEANNKHGQAVRVNSRNITRETIFRLLFNKLAWKLVDVFLQLQKSLIYFLEVFMLK